MLVQRKDLYEQAHERVHLHTRKEKAGEYMYCIVIQCVCVYGHIPVLHVSEKLVLICYLFLFSPLPSPPLLVCVCVCVYACVCVNNVYIRTHLLWLVQSCLTLV